MKSSGREDIRIVTWNINGWRAAQRKGLSGWLAAAAPDIVCLQETRLSEAQIAAFVPELEDYSCVFRGGSRSGYSGTAILSRVPPLYAGASGEPTLDAEGRTTVAEFPNLMIVNVYTPNGNRGSHRLRYKLRFLNSLQRYLRKLAASGYAVIVCGDFNTAHTTLDLSHMLSRTHRSGCLPTERKRMDALLREGWRDAFRLRYPDRAEAFTWWAAHANAKQRNLGWRFDYIFVHESLAFGVNDVLIHSDVTLSDHCPCTALIETGVKTPNDRTRSGSLTADLSFDDALPT